MAVDYQIRFESSARRVRVELHGTLLADSRRALILHETRLPPAYYFPREDLQFALFERSAHVTHCPFKGDATYWNVGSAENAIWTYREPIESATFLLGYMAPYWHLMDAWFEEDEQLDTRFRDPYHRIDVRETSARVTVRANGEVIARSERPHLLFETGHRVRAYLRPDEVSAVLAPSDKTTVCPYKGTASYWSVAGVPDAVWSYRDPIPEAGAIEGLLSFDGDGVEVEIERD